MLSIRRTEPQCYIFILDYYQKHFGIALPKTDAKSIDDVIKKAEILGFYVTSEPAAGDLIVMQRYVEIHFGVFVDNERFVHASYGKEKTSSLEAVKRRIVDYVILAHDAIRSKAQNG